MKNKTDARVCLKCKRALPSGYKFPFCEACRNQLADGVKKVGKIGGRIFVVALAIISGGKTIKELIDR